MSSQGFREEARRLSVRTLAIASLASATAAVIVSQFWQGGTPIAAAVTPVLVALISEMLHKPTAKIAERVTVDRAALRPRASDPGPEEARRTMPVEPAPAPPGEERRASGPGDVRVYRSAPKRPRVSPRLIAVTGALAFVIAVAALTLPELIAGQSLGNSGRGTTIFAGKKKSGSDGNDNRDGENRRQAPDAETDEQPEPSEERPEQRRPQTTKPEEPEPKPEPEPVEPAPELRQAPEEEDPTVEPVPEPAPAPQAPPQ